MVPDEFTVIIRALITSLTFKAARLLLSLTSSRQTRDLVKNPAVPDFGDWLPSNMT